MGRTKGSKNKPKDPIASGKPGAEDNRKEWNEAAKQSKLPIAEAPTAERVELELEHELTEEEKRIASIEMAGAKVEIDRIEKAIADEKAASKLRIELLKAPKDPPGQPSLDTLKETESRLAQEVSTGTRTQLIDCRIVKDPRLQEVRTYRLDRGGAEGELIEDGDHKPRAMTADERESFVFGVPPDDAPLDPPPEE